MSHWDQLTDQYHNNPSVRPFYFEWFDMDAIFDEIHTLSLDPEQNKEMVDKILKTIHYEMLYETFRYLPEANHQEVLDNMKHTKDFERLFGSYDISIEVLKNKLKQKAETVNQTILDLLQSAPPED